MRLNSVKELESLREDVELRLIKLKNLRNELEELKKEKDSMRCLPEFVNDTVTDYSRPTPSIDVSKDVSDEQKAIWKSNSASFSEQGGSVGNVVSKPMISLQRQHSLMEAKIQSQDLEITQLKTKIKTLEDNEKMREGFAQEDAPNMGAINILASGGSKSVFTTASIGVSPVVATASGSFPTATVFTTASVATPRVTRSSTGIVIEPSSPISVNIPSISKKDKGKGIMTEPEKPSKEKVLDQISAQLAKELEEEFALEDQRIREQAERDSEIVRIHAQ
ncbi:hypothetical protein Tco_1251322 [Tanacetum coccineum]